MDTTVGSALGEIAAGAVMTLVLGIVVLDFRGWFTRYYRFLFDVMPTMRWGPTDEEKGLLFLIIIARVTCGFFLIGGLWLLVGGIVDLNHALG